MPNFDRIFPYLLGRHGKERSRRRVFTALFDDIGRVVAEFLQQFLNIVSISSVFIFLKLPIFSVRKGK